MTETAEQRAERIQRYIDKTHQRFVDSLSLNMPEINTSVMCEPVRPRELDADWAPELRVYFRSRGLGWE